MAIKCIMVGATGDLATDRVEVFFSGYIGEPMEFSWRRDITSFFESDGTMTKENSAVFYMVYPEYRIVPEMVKYLLSLHPHSEVDHLAMGLNFYEECTRIISW